MKKLLIFIIFIMPAVIFPADYFQEDLSYAVRYGDIKFIRNYKGNINAPIQNGLTPFITAVEWGKVDSIEALMEAGADVNVTNSHGLTALMILVNIGLPETAKEIIKAGANVNAITEEGLTALMGAAEWGKRESIEILIEAGADVNLTNSIGRTALMCAAKEGQTDSAKALIAAAADVDAVDREGRTALIFAASNKQTETVKALIEGGADANIADKSGRTALMFATKEGQMDAVKALIEGGANVSVADKDGNTVLKLAQNNDISNILQSVTSQAPSAGSLSRPRLPPDLELAVAANVGPQNLLKAGKSGTVTLTITNRGKGDGVGLDIEVKGISGTDGVSLLSISNVSVKAGHIRVLSLPISAGKNVASGVVKYEITVKEKYFKMDSNPVLLSIQTMELLKPDLYLHDWGVNNGEDETAGNGKNTINEGETVNVEAIIANRGMGEAKDVMLTVILPKGQGLTLLDESRIKLGDLPSGDWRKVPIPIAIGKNLSIKQFRVKLQFSDIDSYSSTNAVIQLAIGSMRETPKEVVVMHGKTESRDAPVVNAPTLSVDVDTRIPEGYSIQSNAIAVVIGNRDYQNGIAAVDYALQDERIMKRYFESAFKIPAGQIIAIENVSLSGFFGLFGTEREPTKSRLYRNVQNYNPDTVYVYYSGHGIPGLKDHKGYLAPVDVDKENVEETAYSLDLLYSNMARLKKIGVRHIVVILESCFSGDSEGGRLVQNISPVIMKVDNPLTAENIGSIYAATSGSDYSVWYPEMGHGLFTYYFLKGLSGEADQKKNRKITLAEMRAYLEKNVPKRANILRAFEQMPQVIGNDNEVLVRLK